MGFYSRAGCSIPVSRQGGNIINIGSVASEGFNTSFLDLLQYQRYGRQHHRVFAKELGPNQIRVSAVNPGPNVTEVSKSTGFEGSDTEKS